MADLHLQSSQMNTFMECPRKWFYEYHLWRGVKATPPMVKGTVFHLCGELFYKDGVAFEDLSEAVADIEAQKRALNPNNYEQYTPHLVEVLPAFLQYRAKYDQDPYEWYVHEGKIAIELEFKMELAEGIYYHGKFDGLRVRDGKLYIFDWKVTSMALTDWYFKKFEMCYQTFSYSFTGKTYFPDLNGFFIDGIQIKNGAHTFCRKYFPLLGMFDEFVAELIRTAEWIQDHIHDENYFEHRYTACVNKYNKLCPFSDVCTANERSRKGILMSGLYVDNKPIYDFT
jgi:hypothetical protein